MPIIPWKPFDDLDQFFSDDNWFLSKLPKSQRDPVMDVYETDKEVIAEIDLPGVDPEKVDISFDRGILRIVGTEEEKKEEKEKGYWRKEVRRGSFERAVQLPAEIEEGKVEAEYKKGVLKIVMPKARKVKSEKKLKIKIKE